MRALVIVPAGAASSVKGSAQSIVRITPPDIARRHLTTLDGIQADAVEVIRREPFEYGFKAPCHMLIMSERQERDDGETLLEGLPKSTLREFSRKLSFVPAGRRFFGWQKPRVLARVTYFYRASLISTSIRADRASIMSSILPKPSSSLAYSFSTGIYGKRHGSSRRKRRGLIPMSGSTRKHSASC
jgi:hypothetical protein